MPMWISGAPRRIVLLLLIVLLMIGSGCGENGQGNRDGNPNAGNQVQGREISIESGEFYFEPREITVDRGETVTLVVTNKGDVKHNISIDAFDVKRDYANGQTIRVTFTADQAGEFQIYSDEPGHKESGMVATLVVQ